MDRTIEPMSPLTTWNDSLIMITNSSLRCFFHSWYFAEGDIDTENEIRVYLKRSYIPN